MRKKTVKKLVNDYCKYTLMGLANGSLVYTNPQTSETVLVPFGKQEWIIISSELENLKKQFEYDVKSQVISTIQESATRFANTNPQISLALFEKAEKELDSLYQNVDQDLALNGALQRVRDRISQLKTTIGTGNHLDYAEFSKDLRSMKLFLKTNFESNELVGKAIEKIDTFLNLDREVK